MSIALQKARLPLPALVVFLILLFMQGYLVFASEIGGTNGLGETLIMSPVGQSIFVIGMSGVADSNLEIVTMPTPQTNAVSDRRYADVQSYATLNGQVTAMGVASSTYAFFDWGYDPAALTNTETMGAMVAIGSQSKETEVDSGETVYYRFRVRNGAVDASGSTVSFTSLKQIDAYPAVGTMAGIVPLVMIIGFLFGAGIVTVSGFRSNDKIRVFVGLLMIAVALILFAIPVAAIDAILAR